MSGAVDYAAQWIFPGGSSNNKQAFEGRVRFETGIGEEERMLLFDAQTSGGLLIALSEECVPQFVEEMARRDVPWWRIGSVAELGVSPIMVLR
jgi:selenide,water dikinase